MTGTVYCSARYLCKYKIVSRANLESFKLCAIFNYAILLPERKSFIVLFPKPLSKSTWVFCSILASGTGSLIVAKKKE